VQLLPSKDGGRFNVTLSGNTHSNTVGVTDQANVYTSGAARFQATKEVLFDGHDFITQPAQIFVQANNTTLGAETSISWIPILGWIADSIAESRAQDMEPQSEAVSRQRVAQRVLPRMNSEVNNRFANESRDLETGLYQRLKDAGVYPRLTDIRSSSSHLRISSQVMKDGELGGASTNVGLQPGPGLTIHGHETLLNNAAARMNLAGRTMTDSEVREEIERFLSTIAGEKVELSAASPAAEEDESVPKVFVWEQTDPLRCRIGDGVVTLIMRTGFKRDDGTVIPPKEIEVPLTFHVRSDAIYIEADNARVTMIERVAATQHIGEAQAIRKKMKSAFDGQKRSRKFMLQREGKRDLPVWITKMRALNGWMTVWGQ
jgi:hypothetical protein